MCSDIGGGGCRRYYLPLGELEIDALCRLYQMRLHVIKTEALDLIVEAQAAHAGAENAADLMALETKVLPLLNKVKEQVTPWEEAREVLDTVLLYVGNILDNPEEDKFKVLKQGNSALQRRVLSKTGGRELLMNLGFEALDNAQGEAIFKLKDSLPPHPGPSWFPAARRALQTFLAQQGCRALARSAHSLSLSPLLASWLALSATLPSPLLRSLARSSSRSPSPSPLSTSLPWFCAMKHVGQNL